MLDKNKFIDWIMGEFPDELEANFTYDMLENIIDYAMDNMSNNQVVKFLCRIIPEITEIEIDEFIQ